MTQKKKSNTLHSHSVDERNAPPESRYKVECVVPAEIFLKVHTWEQLKEVSWQAMYDHILRSYGEASALQFKGSKSPSKHPRYKVAANAVTRAKGRAEELGWIHPRPSSHKFRDSED
ncbi:hypothetical protein [Caballeronia sp. J97]|uniref:hypothetical protein n=1 Tax=Caballeronia sp. J97 TaxID=2805429 RepID=UPI002AB11A64|nr:hypothetical protein [Caballeronia sp. J97]